MPVYLYVCRACESQREVLHGINESPPTQCAACGGVLERVFTAPRLNLGSGSSPTAAKYAKMSPAEEVAYAQAEIDAVRLSKRPKAPPVESAG